MLLFVKGEGLYFAIYKSIPRCYDEEKGGDVMGCAAAIKAVYEKLLTMPDLHSVPQLEDGILIWKIYKNAYIQALCDGHDAHIHVISNSLTSGSLACWHTNADDLFRELYALGRKGNMLVIKKTLLGTRVFYSGNAAQYPITDKREWDFGKKKYDFGTLIYLEQR